MGIKTGQSFQIVRGTCCTRTHVSRYQHTIDYSVSIEPIFCCILTLCAQTHRLIGRESGGTSLIDLASSRLIPQVCVSVESYTFMQAKMQIGRKILNACIFLTLQAVLHSVSLRLCTLTTIARNSPSSRMKMHAFFPIEIDYL
jgi:hypothetical protein